MPALAASVSSSAARFDRRGWLGALVCCVLALAADSPGPAAADAPAPADSPMPAGETLALTGATLIDGTGRQPIADAVVVIRAGRIVCADSASACPVPDGAREVSLVGQWVTPGLIDAHVHLFFLPGREPLREQTIRFSLGITTTRDAGTGAVKKALAERRVAASPGVTRPRLSVAAVVGEWNYDQLLGGRQDPNALVEKLDRLGVDAIKLKDAPSAQAAVMVVKAARAHGLPVFGHTWGDSGVVQAEAIAAGLGGVSHLGGAVRMVADPQAIAAISPTADDAAAWQARKALWLTADAKKADAVIADMVEHDVWLEPSLAFEYNFGRFMRYPERMSFLNPMASLREMLFDQPDPAPGPVFPEPFAAMSAFVGKLHARGGRLVASGDGALPGWDVIEEVHHLRHAGLSPMQALQCATQHAAVAIGRGDDLGTLEPGKIADLVVYGADPLGRRANMAEVRQIVKGGVVHRAGSVLRPYRELREEEIGALWRARALKLGGAGLVALLGLVGLIWLVRRARRQREPLRR